MLWEKVSPDLWQKADSEQKWLWRSSLLDLYREKISPAFPALKTHTTNSSVFGHRAFQFRPGDRAIYLVRHPLDLAVSYADFNGREIDKAIETMSTPGIWFDSGQPGGFELRGSWWQHVTSWVNCRSCPVLLVRYEDLCDDTEACLRKMLTFLGIKVDDGRLRQAVQFSSFASLQRQEESEGFQERPSTAASGRFFREGRARQWLKALSPEQAQRLADHCGEVMVKLGYTHPRDVYFDGRNAYGPIKL